MVMAMPAADMAMLLGEIKGQLESTQPSPPGPLPLVGLASAPAGLGRSPSAQDGSQSQGHGTPNTPDTPILEGSDTVAASSSAPLGGKAAL